MKITAYGIGSQIDSIDEASVTFPKAHDMDVHRVNKLINYLEDRVSRRPEPKCYEDPHEVYFLSKIQVSLPQKQTMEN